MQMKVCRRAGRGWVEGGSERMSASRVSSRDRNRIWGSAWCHARDSEHYDCRAVRAMAD